MKKIILFIHGIIGTPEQFNILYPEIPEGIEYDSIILKGHGGSVDDFSNASMKDWQEQVDKKIKDLQKDYDEIYLVGHSMGTLFILQRINYDKVKSAFLMAVPLKIKYNPLTTLSMVKAMIAQKIKGIEPDFNAYYGIENDLRFWKYLGWIPNYLNLFNEMSNTKKLLKSLNFKNKIYLLFSKKDELIRVKSKKYFEDKNCEIKIIKNSGHYLYDKDKIEIKEFYGEWIREEVN